MKECAPAARTPSLNFIKMKMKIAIIGGGVSGLSLAYYLESKKIDFVLFEKEKNLGGNAYTRKAIHNGKVKYVDMAVNDFNPHTYVRLMHLLEKTGSLTGRVNVDTTFYSSGRFLFRESDLQNTALGAEIRRFKYEAVEVLRDRKYYRYSVIDYFEEKGYSDEFLNQYLYPRIQGLFFYPPGGMSALPVRFLMNFYALQGGFKYRSEPAATRFNFKGGAGAWIANLARQIPAEKIITGEIPKIERTANGFRVKNARNEVMADKLAFACHADDLCKSYGDILTPEQLAILSRIKYAKMISVAHCDTSYLPVSKSDFSAYNCHVKDPADPGNEYTITYNCNEHQNPTYGGKNSSCDCDYFFVTVNPQKKIGDKYILRDKHGEPLVKEFRRNICDFDLLRAQRELLLQQGIDGIYFTGGYTNGIGLHENCLQQSFEIAEVLHRLQRKPALILALSNSDAAA